MDVGMITNSNNAVENSQVTKETKQSEIVKKYGMTGKTIGQTKLSKEAQEYYEQLKAKYKDMDFILVKNDMMDVAKSRAGSFANPNKTLVLVDEETIERMATDEAYRKQQEGMLEYAQKKLPELQKALKNVPGSMGCGVQINENGTVSFFAVMNKAYDEQAQTVEKRMEAKAAEKKAEQKKAQKEKQKEWLEEKREENKVALEKLNSENVKDVFAEYKKDDVVLISAGSLEELLKKVEEYNFSVRADHIKSEAEKYVGTVIDFKG